MPDSLSGRLVNEVVRLTLAPALKSCEFARKHHTWNRRFGELVHVVELQPGRWNQAGRGDLTVNIGVFDHVVYGVLRGKEAPAFAKELDCVFRAHLGAVMPGGVFADGPLNGQSRYNDWVFTPESDPTELGEDIRKALLGWGIPFLEKFDTLRSVHDFVAARPGEMDYDRQLCVHQAVLKWLLGYQNASSETLAKFEMGTNPTFATWAGQIRERLQAMSAGRACANIGSDGNG
jgi:hypothetical protein